MNDWQRKVREFHHALGQPVADRPGEIPSRRRYLRTDLIAEEFDEVLGAIHHEELHDVARELVDLLYVTLGTAVEYGIDLAPVFDAVHAANMAKAGGPVRADGKVLKPEGWEPADVAALVRAQMEES